MKLAAWSCVVTLLGGLSALTAHGQNGGIVFANSGTGWVAPWYGPGASNVNHLSGSPSGVGSVPVGNQLLEGPGFTAELWGAPEGSSVWNLQYLARTQFRTGATAGLFVPSAPVAIPFVASGERAMLQVRVYENWGGTVTSWAQAYANCAILYGTSDVFISPPLGDSAVTLEGMKAYCLSLGCDTVPLTLPLPVLSISTDTNIKYLSSTARHRPVLAGETVTLESAVPNPATIQWRLQGTNLPGATNRTLILTNVQFAQAGMYSAETLITVSGRPLRGTNEILVNVGAARLSQLHLSPSGFFASVDGISNRWFAIEKSPDLLSWMPWRTQFVANGWCACRESFSFTIPPPLNAPQFYRLRAVPLGPSPFVP